jgi:hypothetical protein
VLSQLLLAGFLLTLSVLAVMVLQYFRSRDGRLMAAVGDEIINKPIDFVALHTAMARVFVRRI